MEDLNKNHNPNGISVSEADDPEDLDRFIEKRKIQNEALMKIAGIKLHSSEKKDEKKK